MKTIFLIGREPDCDIILWNNEISRHHAQIRIDQKGKLWLMRVRMALILMAYVSLRM